MRLTLTLQVGFPFPQDIVGEILIFGFTQSASEL
jgi:hypothetical protein